ncbi:MAG: FAD-dependent oxidoreductase [Erythrobacter sp.]
MDEGRHLLLVGGGHAHVAVLADWIRKGLPCERATLLTPQPKLRYSGTVPGWISGQYSRNFGTVDVAALTERAGAELLLGKCTAIDPETRHVITDSGEHIGFDAASIDTGGTGRAGAVLGDDPRLLDIRPIDRFVERIAAMEPPARIALIGGGAGGTELAMGLRNWRGAAVRPEVLFVTGSEGLLTDMSSAVRRKVTGELERQGIRTIVGDADMVGDTLTVEERSLEPVDLIVAALGSAAPAWPRAGGLAANEAGFILVDEYQRSTSHPHIFAVGDVAARQDRQVPHSGVHAVFAGPVLAHNLRAAMAGGGSWQSYRPRSNNLYLLSTGTGEAIASYGPLAARGRWVSKLKHWIDNRWLRKYARLARGE